MHDGGIHVFHFHLVDDMFVKCENTKAGTHITKLDTMGKMKRKVPCLAMVSDMSFTWFGGTFLNLEMMFVC